jgi:5-methylcytosine-specific restriction endonuclease McrA
MEKENQCVYCERESDSVEQHHFIPRSQGGKETVSTCPSCEDFIHSTWSNSQLAEILNSVELIKQTQEYQRFKKWLDKQPNVTYYKTKRNKIRNKKKFS